MLKFLKKRLSNEQGGMDNIIVALLFIVIAVVGLIGFSTWSIDNKDSLEMQATMQIDKILEENAPAASGSLLDDLDEYSTDYNIDEEIILDD